MNTQNYLAASDLAYRKLNEKELVDGIDGIRYEVVKALHTQSGYDGYILHRKDTNELIVAHRGTWPEKGALTTDVPPLCTKIIFSDGLNTIQAV